MIHTDFERGFIKAETVAYEELVACGSVAAARDKGLYRMEGKEYVVADGDVLLFKFKCLTLLLGLPVDRVEADRFGPFAGDVPAICCAWKRPFSMNHRFVR